MRSTIVIAALLAAAPALVSAADALPFCPPQPTHTYLGGVGAVRYGSVSMGFDVKAGQVTVKDTNVVDCNGNGVPLDHDGDYDLGFGGGFFGWGPWAVGAPCNYNHNVHGPEVIVTDATGWPMTFQIGADDTNGPVLIQDPTTGGWICVTDGLIAPTLDWDDCLAGPYVTWGGTCGAGGDGGYWVILETCVDELGNGAFALCNVPTGGIITAGFFGAPYTPYLGNGFIAVHWI